jgi:hypothetical protein
VDIWHAREHLHELAATLAFIVTDPQEWLHARLAELDAGDIEAIIAAATAPEYPLVGVKATDRDKALTYFRTNTVRMRYAHYRDLGMSSAPVTSKPAAKPSSDNASNSPACTGPNPAPPASSPCAPNTPAAPGTRSGNTPTTRSPTPASPSAEPDHGYLQFCRAPSGGWIPLSCRWRMV